MNYINCIKMRKHIYNLLLKSPRMIWCDLSQ